jgi:hypothetical protein
VPARALVVLAAPLALGAAAACAQILGAGDYAVASDDEGSGGGAADIERPSACGSTGVGAGVACDACIREHCCDEAERCHDDPGCDGWAACTGACRTDDGACWHQCMRDHDWTAAAGALRACAGERCGEACRNPVADWAAFGPECGGCISRQAPEALRACLEDPSCTGWVACVFRSCENWTGNPRCRAECAGLFPEAGHVFAALGEQATRCSMECRWGSHWDCSRETLEQQFRPFTAATDLTITVVQFQSEEPVQGVSMRPCHWVTGAEPSCDDPVLTDERGQATVRIDGGRLFTYLEVTYPDGTRALQHSPRVWQGERSFWRIETPMTFATGEGTGTLLASAADCAGGRAIFDVEATGVRMELTRDGESVYGRRRYVEYVGGVPTLLDGPHGSFAVFTDVLPGRAVLEIHHPAGVQRVEGVVVEANTGSVLHANFPPGTW